MNYIAQKAGEGSTWASLASVFASAASFLASQSYSWSHSAAIGLGALAAACAFLGVHLPSQKGPPNAR